MAIFYPLNRKQHHEIVEALKIRRQERKLKRAEKKPLPGIKDPV
jgi:Na+/melibiose symporter-like transporter